MMAISRTARVALPIIVLVAMLSVAAALPAYAAEYSLDKGAYTVDLTGGEQSYTVYDNGIASLDNEGVWLMRSLTIASEAGSIEIAPMGNSSYVYAVDLDKDSSPDLQCSFRDNSKYVFKKLPGYSTRGKYTLLLNDYQLGGGDEEPNELDETGYFSKVTFVFNYNMNDAAISGIKSKTYTGKMITQSPVVKYGGKKLVKGTDYTLSYKNNKAAGTATIVITGKGTYIGSVTKTFKINKAANPLKAKNATVKTTAKQMKKASKAVKASTYTSGKAAGKRTFKKANKAGKSKIAVNAKTGKITLKKGLAKGTYKVRVTVKAAGDANHKSYKKTVTVKVVVK